MTPEVFTLSSFGVGKIGGNKAGVVLDADGLDDAGKQHLAAQVGFSETAFVEHSAKADYKVRFFTTTEEVDLCGHATIAVWLLLFQKGVVQAGNYTQETGAGILKIEVSADGFIFMEQALPQFAEIIDEAEIVDSFGKEFVRTELRPQIVSTGGRDLMLFVGSREELFALQPNREKIISLSKQYNFLGIHAFTFETIEKDAVAHCRDFAPGVGIDEESATGSAMGALACYLFKNKKLTDRDLNFMRFEQGYSMSQPSEIWVRLRSEGKDITQVWVGGKAV